MSAVADNPDDLEARYRASASRLMQDDYDGAMEQLLRIARRDRGFRNEIARKGPLAIFSIWAIRESL